MDFPQRLDLTSNPRLNPFPWYRQMRETDPVSFNPEFGAWSVFRYDDVQQVLSDYATFSSRFGLPAAAQEHPLAASLIATDPPRHRELRALVSQGFTPRAIGQLEPRINEISSELLDHVAPNGRMDVVDDFSYPLPVIVIAELLGIPTEDRALFKAWSDAVVSGQHEAASGRYHGGAGPMRDMSAYFLRTMAERRQVPGSDLISALLAAQEESQHLEEMDVLAFCILLLVAGNETTTNLIANAVICFEEFPWLIDDVREHPELLPGLIEEVLRYRSPVQSMFRTVARETDLGDKKLHPGQRVVAWIGSANRDDRQFSDPDQFNPRRSPNRHLAFGNGIHFCLGAPLARLEAKIALGQMLQRFSDLRILPGTALEPLSGHVVYGVQHLPITFKTQRIER